MKEAKPIDVSGMKPLPSTKIKFTPINPVKVPKKVEEDFLQTVGKYTPGILLAYGKSALLFLADSEYTKDVLPAPIPFLLRWTAKGISFFAKRFSVKEKDLPI